MKSCLPTLVTIAIVAALAASALGSLPASAGVRRTTGSTYAGVETAGVAGSQMGESESSVASPAWEVIANTSVGVRPVGVVANYDETDLMVTNSGSDNISVVSTVNYSVLDSIPVGSDPVAIAEGPFVGVNNSTEEFYVANENSSNITVIDDWAVAGSIPVGQGPDGIAYDSSSGLLYVANRDSDNVTVINGTRDVASIPVGLAPAGIAWDPADGYIYVANAGSNNVSVLNGTAQVGSISVGIDPTAVWYYRWFGDVEVSDTGSNNVSWISGLSLRTSFPVGFGPVGGVYLQGISADAGEGPVFVANSGSDNVSVLNGSVQLQPVPVLSNPTGITTAGTYYLYVTDTGSNEVSVITQVIPEPKYHVHFSETGLQPWTNWSITIAGVSEVSSDSYLNFTEPNGSYSYTVSNQTGYTIGNRTGIAVVAGSNVSVGVTFVGKCYGYCGKFPVTFSESGLPSGNLWNVLINGSALSGTGSLSILLLNGSYTWEITLLPSGDMANPSQGTLTVNGGPVTIAVTVAPIGPATHLGPPTGTPTPLWVWVLIAAIIVAAAAVVVVLVRHRRTTPPARP